MLDVNPDDICRLIALAREFHAQEQVVIPEEPGNPSGDWSQQILASHVEDATLQEFMSIIKDLEPRQQQQVVGLLWIGRGDFELEDWDAVLEQARDSWTVRTGNYLIAHPLLADYLTEGLDLHGYRCE